MFSRFPKIASNLHFWIVLAMFAIGIVLHYPQQILSTGSPSLFAFLGLTRHAVERILLLLPIGYAAFVFGTKVGIVCLAVASVIMLPRVFLISQYFPDALLETIGAIFIGSLTNLWFDHYKKEKERRQQVLSKLEMAHQQLQSQVEITMRSEKRLRALNEVSAVVSHYLELGDVLNVAADKVRQVMDLEVVLIFLLDEDKQELELITHRGVSEEFVSGLKGLKVGEGFNGRVAQTAEPLLIENAYQDTRLTREVVRGEGIRAQIIVPLKAKGNVVGTLAGAIRGSRQFLSEEVELLTTIGSQIGMAIENARLYQRERLATEQALVRERQYREIFENAHDAIWIHDLDGNIIAANKAAEELTGYSSKELMRMNVRSFLAEESLNLAGRIRRRLFLGETVEQPYEQRLIRRDKTEAILKLTTNLIREDGTPKGFQHIARDVTREKEMQDRLVVAYRDLSESHQRLKESQEQLIQAERLSWLGHIAGSIAHEVNNPLGGVLIYTQLLAKKIVGNSISKDDSLDYLSKMEFELIRSTKLIRNLLDFAQQSVPTLIEVNVNNVINGALELVAHSAERQNIQVTKELDPDLPGVMADLGQLQQVFMNLILNAIEAMPEGGKLTVHTSVDSGNLKIQFQDTGLGIAPENIPKLFTPFFTTKKEVKGVGLSLAVAYGIIQRHQGRIEVQSEEREGTTFTIYLPLSHKEHEAP